MDSYGPLAIWRWLDVLDNIDLFIKGFGYTLLVAFMALIIAIFLGVLSGLMSTSKIKLFNIMSRVYVEFFQNTPLLINLFFLYYVLPMIPYIGVTLDIFVIGFLGIGIYHGAYMSEVTRSGIQSISKGQFEAAYSQGFKYYQLMTLIILPQTIKIILPPSTNQAINLTKNTSVLAIFAGAELMYMSDSYAQSTLSYAPSYIIAGAFYFTICYGIAYFTRRYEIKLKTKHLAR